MLSRLALTFCVLVSVKGLAQEPQAATPGKEHKLLHHSIGERTGTMKMWPVQPGGESMSMPMKETNTLLHNGLWVRSTFEVGPYAGCGVMGYDTEKKKYVGNWIDNQSTGMSVMEGTYNEAKKELTMTFRGKNNMGETADMKSVTKFSKPETFSMMQKGKDGKWGMVFEVTYD